MDDINACADKLERVVHIAGRLGIRLDRCEFTKNRISVSDAVSLSEDLYKRVSDLRDEIARLLAQAEENEQIIRQLEHIRGVDFDLHDLFEVEFVRFRFGRLPRPVYDGLSGEMERSDEYCFFATSIEKDFIYGMILTPRVNANMVDALFASYGFERIYIDGKVRGSSEEAVLTLRAEANRARKEAEALAAEADRIIADEADAFLSMFGDIGQGIVVAAVGYLMWRLKKMWLGRIHVFAVFAGSAFGFLYGSFFGFEHLLPFGFKVLESAENTARMLRAAVFTGTGVILAMMCINIINGIRQKDYEKALFS